MDERFNPFPGLRPFQTDEAHLFFGREGQSLELLRLLREQRFVAVVGPSGSGKSSLVRAGLLPSLHGGFMRSAGSDWRVALLRPGASPIANLARSLSPLEVLGADAIDERDRVEFMEITLRRGSLGLAEAMLEARLEEDQNLLVVVDQFEEIFRFQRVSAHTEYRDEAAAFVKLLLEASRAEVPVYVLLTMRSDYLGDCAQFRDLPEAINHGQYLIPRMTRDERRAALTGPVAVGGSTIAPRLVSRILNDVGAEPDQLPILQHALMRAWDRWERERDADTPLDLAHYEAIGGAQEALSRHAEEAYAELDEAGKEVAEKVFRRLTERGSDNRDIRRPTRFAELCAIVDADPATVAAVIDVFRRPGRSFLMPPADVPLEADTLVDISHESLIRGWARLQEWVAEERDAARRYQRLAETAALWRAGRAGLLDDPELSHMVEWWEQDTPTAAWGAAYQEDFATTGEYLARSREARDRRRAEERQKEAAKRRRRRLAVAALVIGLVATSGLALVALQQSRTAQHAREAAERDRAIAVAAGDSLAIESEARAAETVRARQAERDAQFQLERALEAEEQAQLRLAQALAAEEATQLQLARARSADRRTMQGVLHQRAALRSVLTNAKRDASLANAPSLLRQEASTLSYLRLDSLAEQSYSNALRLNPMDPMALVNRSDTYLNLGQPERARADLEVLLARDPHHWLAHLNMAVAQMLLGQHDDAAYHIRRAIDAAEHRANPAGQSNVSSQIRRVTGYGSLDLARHEIRAALRYALASTFALSGGSGGSSSSMFGDSLARADAEEEWTLSAVLNPLNWLWLFRRDGHWSEVEDYGALAAEGALWERAGWSEEMKGTGEFAREAARSYCRFQRVHEDRSAERYASLARWVDARLATMGSRRCADLDLDPPPPPGDLEDLKLEAEQRLARGEHHAVDSLYARALEAAPPGERPYLLLDRGRNRLSLEDWDGAAADADAALGLLPTLAGAHLLQGRARYGAASRDDFSDEGRVADIVASLDTALAHEPTAAVALALRAYALSHLYPREAAASLRGALELEPAWAFGWVRLALTEMLAGETRAASEAAEVAVLLAPDSTDYHEVALAAAQGFPAGSRDWSELYNAISVAGSVSLPAARRFRERADAAHVLGDLLRAERFYLAALREYAEAAAAGQSGLNGAISEMARRFRCIFRVHGADQDPRRRLDDRSLALSNATGSIRWPSREALRRANLTLQLVDRSREGETSCPLPSEGSRSEATDVSVYARFLDELGAGDGIEGLPALPRSTTVDGTLEDGLTIAGRHHALWVFHGEEGETVSFILRSDDFDAYLYLFDHASAELLAFDDDGHEGRNSLIRMRLPRSGPYIVVVTSFGQDEEGTYTLEHSGDS